MQVPRVTPDSPTYMRNQVAPLAPLSPLASPRLAGIAKELRPILANAMINAQQTARQQESIDDLLSTQAQLTQKMNAIQVHFGDKLEKLELKVQVLMDRLLAANEKSALKQKDAALIKAIESLTSQLSSLTLRLSQLNP